MAHQISGRWGTKWLSSKTTTAYAIGDLLYNDGTNVIPAVSTSGNITGICVSAKASGETGTRSLMIKEPKDRNAKFVAAVTGTFTKADEGKYFDLSDKVTVNTAATTYKVVKCEQYINSTTGVFSINDPIS